MVMEYNEVGVWGTLNGAGLSASFLVAGSRGGD